MSVMYKLRRCETEERAYVPEQLVDLIMRSPEMNCIVAPTYN